MRTKETAVMFYVLGMLTGMILAFASCSAEHPVSYEREPMSTVQHR